MEDSEKLTALKKAYADILLNTAKEAAARIMISERKAVRFQRELLSTKEEAIRMLLRLKQMLDAKACEAERTSLSQQKKIEELEAQLHEAEEIVRDLRAELREVQAELDNMKNHQGHHVDDQYYETCDVPVNGTFEGSKCLSAHGHINNCSINSPDFASIVIRRKEPELYRNGCTQRIRAFERNLFDRDMPLPAKVDDIKVEASKRGDEDKEKCKTPSLEGKNMGEEEEKLDRFETIQADPSYVKEPAIKSFHRKRKRATRFKKGKAPLSKSRHNQVMEMQKAHHLLNTHDFSSTVHNKDKLGENSPMTCESESQNDPVTPPPSLKVPCDSMEMIKQYGFVTDTDGDEEPLKACSAPNKSKGEKELMDESNFSRQEIVSAGSLEVPASNKGADTVSESLDSLNFETSDVGEKVSCQSVNDRLLKYTFRRKRKKESLSILDGDSSLDKSISKKAGEKQNGHADCQKSCVTAESSRDSRRLAQVARQLISLSEKKWWQ